MPDKCQCPTCGEECESDDSCECPECERAGCNYCMPLGSGNKCPDCEDEEGAQE
jgi:hypothetical protein